MDLEITTAAGDFQADDEGSIPFTRSKSFKDLASVMKLIISDCCVGDEAPATSLHGSMVAFRSCISPDSDHVGLPNLVSYCQVSLFAEGVVVGPKTKR